MGEAAAGRVKGVLLVHLREYVVERHGNSAWEALELQLAAIDAPVWSAFILSSAWYPVGAWNRAFAAFLRAQPDRDGEIRRLANFVAQRDIAAVFRVVLRVARPEHVLSRVPSIYSRYFDTGTMMTLERGPRRWQATLDGPRGDEAGPGEQTCIGVCGWIERALELTGQKTRRVVQARCRFHGAPICEYDVTW